MKLLKGISFFVLYPILLLTLGFYTGVKTSHYFYAEAQQPREFYIPEGTPIETNPVLESAGEKDGGDEMMEPLNHLTDEELGGYGVASGEDGLDEDNMEEDDTEEDAEEVLFAGDTLCVDTQYVLEEMDILNHTVVENTLRLPSKYVGMNREQFLQAMDIYEMSPPLSELERGFIGLEVLTFSRDRVVIQMNYKYVQPTDSFYLAVYNNRVVVYLDDMKTIYIETEIELDSLPEDVQQDIMGMMWVENEETLYDLLESYSS